jgi:hypothetical protein
VEFWTLVELLLMNMKNIDEFLNFYFIKITFCDKLHVEQKKKKYQVGCHVIYYVQSTAYLTSEGVNEGIFILQGLFYGLLGARAPNNTLLHEKRFPAFNL